jgi:hypothetical protein
MLGLAEAKFFGFVRLGWTLFLFGLAEARYFSFGLAEAGQFFWFASLEREPITRRHSRVVPSLGRHDLASCTQQFGRFRSVCRHTTKELLNRSSSMPARPYRTTSRYSKRQFSGLFLHFHRHSLTDSTHWVHDSCGFLRQLSGGSSPTEKAPQKRKSLGGQHAASSKRDRCICVFWRDGTIRTRL